jgi:uncharacterized protein (UPF0305 family)
MNTNKYIKENYDKLLSKARRMKNFNEDVFHDTLLYLLVNEDKISEESILNYIIKALHINFIRETKYKRNNNHTNTQIADSFNNNIGESITDIKIIFGEIESKFGSEILECYKMYINGFSLREIQLEFPGVKNLNSKLKKIENYISGI